MKRVKLILGIMAFTALGACSSESQQSAASGANAATQSEEPAAGQASVQDDESQKNVVQIAAGSQDHSTLVTAVKTAGLADVLVNAGPFTVFAPTNAAFEKLPAGTVDGLLKPEKREDLRNILQYHVYVGTLQAESFTDGQTLGQVNGGRVTMGVKDGQVTVNGAKILASVPASNGVIHIIDQVLLPK